MARLELEHIVQRYGAHCVVDRISLQVEAGGVACLLGPSGCGKTTLLRCIAGFEPIVGGEIRLADEVLSRPGRLLPPELRRVGMVFQDGALFPHLPVWRNIAFGLRRQSAAEQHARVHQLLEMVGLAGLGDRYPHELSGGQQQRVALARALAPRPRLLLLDEPFSSLDVDLRQRLALDVRNILKQEGMTAILVTHDQQEAFAMADEIGVMWQGRIAQWDTPNHLYHRPRHRFIAEFIGRGVLLPGRIGRQGRVAIDADGCGATYPCVCYADAVAPAAGSRVDVLLRPENVVCDARGPLAASVSQRAFRGADALYTLRLDNGAQVLAQFSAQHDLAVGQRAAIRLVGDSFAVFASG